MTRVLAGSAIADMATRDSIYGAAFLVASVELGTTLVAPSTALMQAWAGVSPADRPLLELLQDAPTLVVDQLDVDTATAAGIRAHTTAAGAEVAVAGVDVAAAHAVEVARRRDCAILTADPAALRAIDPDVEIDELPGTA